MTKSNDKPTLADIASPNPSPAAREHIQKAVDASMAKQREVSDTPDQLTLEDIIYCDTGCGSNADPADGFGYCTCGAEKQRARVLRWVNDALNNCHQLGITDLELYEHQHDGEEMDVVDRQQIRNNLLGSQQ